MQKPLWAPWRMEFIESTKDSRSGCVFCDLPKSGDDRKALIAFRGKLAFIILNKFPYNNGHIMIVPNQHVADLTQLSADVMTEMMTLTQKCIKALEKAYKPQGYNLGANLGAAAGAGIKDHVHLHVVPRWIGDTNFMPVVGDVKAMPQHLEKSYDLLHAKLKEDA